MHLQQCWNGISIASIVTAMAILSIVALCRAKLPIGCYNTPVMNPDTFAELVTEALEALPRAFQEKLDNVEVVVEDWPDRETMRAAGVHHPAQVLGFYRGVPQTKRTHSYGLVLPDKIVIYRRPIELRCRTMAEMRETIHHVLRHEIAHHFGLDDARLHEIGAY